jgi:hypothetical protein
LQSASLDAATFVHASLHNQQKQNFITRTRSLLRWEMRQATNFFKTYKGHWSKIKQYLGTLTMKNISSEIKKKSLK